MNSESVHKLFALCREYEDSIGTKAARQKFWDAVLVLGFSRSEISAARLFIRLADHDGKDVIIIKGGL